MQTRVLNITRTAVLLFAISASFVAVVGCSDDLPVRDERAANRRSRHAAAEQEEASARDAAEPNEVTSDAEVELADADVASPDASEPAAEGSSSDEDEDAGTPDTSPVADGGKEREASETDEAATTEPDTKPEAEPEPMKEEPQSEPMTTDPEMPPATKPRPFFSTVLLEDSASSASLGNGDLWPSCWSDDDSVYTAAGDGTGFGTSLIVNDIFVARIEGAPTDPAAMRGTLLSAGDRVSSIWSGLAYNRKPTGMLCVDGELYVAVQDLRVNTFSDAPAATIARSSDKGRTWSWDTDAPMFSDHVFTTIMFLDFGKDAEHAPDDAVYAYGLDENWDFQTTDRPTPTKLYLAKIPRGTIQDRARWQFFAGFEQDGTPRWDAGIDARKPVLEDVRKTYTMPLDPALPYHDMTVVNQGGVVYDAPLRRYLYTTWTEYTFEFYEAPEPWGPWTLFFSKDFGVTPWNMNRNGGYATTIPSKFISADGTSMWLQSNAWAETGADNYSFSLREFRATPYAASEPMNVRSADSISTPGNRAVVFARAMRIGNPQWLHDGMLKDQSEDSWTGERKTDDYWGYTWPKTLHVNKLRYTNGRKTAEGGWFDELTVQVRHEGEWIAATNVHVEPTYPHDVSLPDYTTFTLSFDEVATDGVRLFGKPGGSGSFTSIAELSAHYE